MLREVSSFVHFAEWSRAALQQALPWVRSRSCSSSTLPWEPCLFEKRQLPVRQAYHCAIWLVLYFKPSKSDLGAVQRIGLAHRSLPAGSSIGPDFPGATKIKLFAARQLILPCWLELNCWSFGTRQSISTGFLELYWFGPKDVICLKNLKKWNLASPNHPEEHPCWPGNLIYVFVPDFSGPKTDSAQFVLWWSALYIKYLSL